MATEPIDQGSPRRPYALAIGGGLLLWWLTAAVAGVREAWDSGLYWLAGYPLSLALAGWLGYRFPDRPWRWGLSVMLAQSLALALTAGGFGLLPLGLILFSILALPAIALARMAAGLRLRRGSY